MELLTSPEAWISLLTLTFLEIVLGVDNIIFIAILAGKLPESQRDKARHLGLMGAFLTRLLLLSLLAFLSHLTEPLFSVFSQEVTGKSLILFAGGIFLIYKATKEIHHKVADEGEDLLHPQSKNSGPRSLTGIIGQIMLLDMVFSIDSVITAVGMASHVSIMVIANLLALGIMLLVSRSISAFVDRYPTIKVLALGFLLMIGLVLVADGAGIHVPKGYIYFAMGFSLFVELINIRSTQKKLSRKSR